MKLANYKDKEKILKAARDKQALTYKGRLIRVVTDLSARRKGMAGNLQCDEQETCAAENPLSSKSVIQNRRRDKSLPKQKLKKFITTKPALQVILRGDSVSEMLQGPQSARDITTSMKPTDITMTLNPYISIITLNVNGLNGPMKRHRYQNG